MSQPPGRPSANPGARSDRPPNLPMHNHEAQITWYTPNSAGAQYSICLLCRVVHVGRISQSQGNTNAHTLMLQDFPEAMFAHTPARVGQTPAQLADTHVVCVQGRWPPGALQNLRIAGVFRLPPPTSLPDDVPTVNSSAVAGPSTLTLTSTSTARNVGSPGLDPGPSCPPPTLSLTLPGGTQPPQPSRRGSQAPDTPATPTGFGYGSGGDPSSPVSETDESTGPNSPRTPLSAREYDMIVSALLQRAGSAGPASAPRPRHPRQQKTQKDKQTQVTQQETIRALIPSRPADPAPSGATTTHKQHKHHHQPRQQAENAVASSSSKAVQPREVIDVDADENENEHQEHESFGVPYVLLGLPDPSQPPPRKPLTPSLPYPVLRRMMLTVAVHLGGGHNDGGITTTPTTTTITTTATLSARLARARIELEANQRARRSPELALRAVEFWVPALRRFLEVQRCAPDARPGPADVKACVGAVLDVLAELEARKDALSYEALLKTRLYNTVKELADANRNTEKLRVSDRARKLIEHWNVYLPGIRVLAKDF
ncbi:hypothetical protein C8Q70DRAFT_1050814 [Cubamyces menziesii]|nr:hypothetical protein C8Q70DRAFT_1050814 [Cubamyces menziesii]